MKTSSIQFVKEARQVAWPWTILMLGGLAVLARPWFGELSGLRIGAWRGLTEFILPVGTFFGSALLAALPLGSEFQFRTIALRFTQPVARQQLWREKFLMTWAAVAPPAVLYCVAVGARFGSPFALMAASWIVVTVAGVIPFTLIARSTLGGMVLNQFGPAVLTFGWMYFEKHGQLPPSWLALTVVAAYSGLMIWLGRRMFLRFQAVDGMQANEAFVPGARLVPQAVAEWFRCRPKQMVGNLVRREVRLLRSLWPLVVLYLAAWIFMVVFRQLPNDKPDSLHVVFVLTVILGVLIAILAGTLSLGEEKTWATHDWHMTLPVAIPLQWAVKLFFASFTSLVCLALMPMAVLVLDGWAGGPGAQFLTGDVALAWMAECVGMTLVAFWCACIVKGTVQATLWVFPLCFAVVLASQGGSWVFNLFAHSIQNLIASVLSRFDVMALDRLAWRALAILERENLALMMGAPLLAAGLIQSLRSFRAQVGANKLRVIRCALPLMIIAFVIGFANDMLERTVYLSWRQRGIVIRETDTAIAALQAASRVEDGGPPRRVSVEELSEAAPLSDVTRRWLRAANVFVGPAPARIGNGPGPYFPGRSIFVVPSSRLKDRVPYSAVIRSRNGSGCSMMMQTQLEGKVGYVTAICQ